MPRPTPRPALAALAVAAVTATSLGSPAPAQASAAWRPRPATYDVVVEHDVEVPMSDGVRLRADIYRPGHNGEPAKGRFPVLVTQTPYNKAVPGASMSDPYMVQRGYVQVVMDVRGTGGSPGAWDAFGAREQRDGYDLVQWAASRRRAWSDGRIGLSGASYGAINQIFTAAQHPTGLKAIFPVVPAGDVYRDVVGTGGQVDLGFMPLWLGAVGGLGLVPPGYTAKDPQEALKVIQQHLGDIGSFEIAMMLNALSGGDKAFDGPFYRQRSPLNVIDRVDVPTFVVGGESDIFQRGEPMLYQHLAARGVPSKFLFGPWTHIQAAGPALGGTLPGTITQPGDSLQVLQLRWYDHYVRGIADPGLDSRANVMYYEPGSGRWPTSTAWPPPSVRYRTYDLAGHAIAGTQAGSLATAPSGGADAAPWSPLSGLCTHSASQWTAGLLGFLDGTCDTDNSENDRNGVVYDLPVTGRPLRLAGDVAAHLNVSTPAKDGQLTVRLEDVAPNGQATQITAGWQVLSLRKLDPSRSVYSGGHLIQPYHPYTQASAQPMPADQPVPVEVEIFPGAASIAPGHTLRVSIQTADFPHLLPPFPQLANSAGPGLKIWHDPAHPSWITLPLLP